MFEQSHIDSAQQFVEDLTESLNAAESMLSNDLNTINTTFIRIYKAPDFDEDIPPQIILVAADTVENDIETKYSRIAAVMQSYVALGADSALITNFSNYAEDHAMVSMVVSEQNAFVFVQPFSIEQGNVIWKTEEYISSQVDEFDFDAVGNDIVSMYYHFTHLNHALYTVEEIYSYLSSQKIVFAPTPGSPADVQYFDFSDLTQEQHLAMQESFK